MQNNLDNFLKSACAAYYEGSPILTDDQFDYLAQRAGWSVVGAVPQRLKVKHNYRMYSLRKIYDDEDLPSSLRGAELFESPKLDGAALSLTYKNGELVQALTRGDGVEGELVTAQVIAMNIVPSSLPQAIDCQIDGEAVALKSIVNGRNYVSGALHLKDLTEAASRVGITFVAYNLHGIEGVFTTYTGMLDYLKNQGFISLAEPAEFFDKFPQDGSVHRIQSIADFAALGHTSSHPRGAVARKLSSDVEVKETILRSVAWQVGSSGKVTPVANFDEVVIEGAKVNKATLHNAGYLTKNDLFINKSTLLVTRSGGIIPQVIGVLND